MITRRAFATIWTEATLARLALGQIAQRRDMAWLNANENPDGPGQAAIEAMQRVLPHAWRYHYREFGEIYETMAGSEGLDSSQVLAGAGSSEILHAAVDAFTSPSTPLIAMHPTYELPVGVARAHGRPVVRVPLEADYAADVRRMAEESEKARGGLVYLCNPNNPTAAITKKSDIAWLVSNLHPQAILLIDEAYIHYGESPGLESGVRYVREGKNVVVARTFSKIYGMAGLRVGFACAKPEFIRRMTPFRDNVISIVGGRAAQAALSDAVLVPERRAKNARIRGELCGWLRKRGVPYVESHTNFVMIDVGRDVHGFIPAMLERGVAPGRPFSPLNQLLRVTIGSESDMETFTRAFAEVYEG